MSNFVLCLALAVTVATRLGSSLVLHGDDKMDKCPAQYNPVCACTPNKPYRTMTFHNDCFLRKYIAKHQNIYCCKLHDQMCVEEDKLCGSQLVSDKVRHFGTSGTECRVSMRPARLATASRRRTQKIVPILYPRGSVPR